MLRHRSVCSSAAPSVVARPVLCGVLRARRKLAEGHSFVVTNVLSSLILPPYGM